MPNVCLSASLRLTMVVSFSLLANAPVWGQGFSGNPYDAGRVMNNYSWGLRGMEETLMNVPAHSEHVPAGPATVSADVLRHPLTSKVRKLLKKALHLAELGDHTAAIQLLRETLVKEPSSAPYAQNILGVEYVESRQFAEARSSFEEAVRLMPHESSNHSNLGYSLAVAGDWNSAEQEVRKAIQLDPANTKAKALLEMLHSRKTKKR